MTTGGYTDRIFRNIHMSGQRDVDLYRVWNIHNDTVFSRVLRRAQEPESGLQGEEVPSTTLASGKATLALASAPSDLVGVASVPVWTASALLLLEDDDLAEQFHEFGRVHEVPSISPVQLNRPPKNGQPALRPDQERIARSSMLVDNANIVVTIDKRKDEHLQKEMRVHIIKMRDGEQSVLVLQKRLDMMRLTDDDVDWEPADYKEASDGDGSSQDG